MARVAFIGLGTMGLPMARNLVGVGHEVVGCDLDASRAQALGSRVVAKPAAAAEGADFVLLSLPSPEVVAYVAAELPRTALLVDMSTGPPALARRLAEDFGAVLDAPVSGGPRGAEAATLTIMVGGQREVFERAEPLLQSLGRPVLVGGPGAGQAAKLCNNLIAGATMVALAEACAVAVREGIDPATLYDLLTTSTGDSRVLRNRFPLPGVDASHPSSNGYEALFTIDLIVEDLALALELAEDAPVAEATHASYLRAQEAGLGELDYSAVYLSKVAR